MCSSDWLEFNVPCSHQYSTKQSSQTTSFLPTYNVNQLVEDELHFSHWLLSNVGKSVGRAGVLTHNPCINSLRRYRVGYSWNLGKQTSTRLGNVPCPRTHYHDRRAATGYRPRDARFQIPDANHSTTADSFCENKALNSRKFSETSSNEVKVNCFHQQTKMFMWECSQFTVCCIGTILSQSQ